MKKTLFSIFSLALIVSMLCLSDASAQEYTQWELPKDAIARLGKGRIEDMQYSPDGTILAVATTIGIWIYDTETYQERSLLAHNNKGVEKSYLTIKGQRSPVRSGSTVLHSGMLRHGNRKKRSQVILLFTISWCSVLMERHSQV